MTNQQILEKAIKKAIAGGWEPWIVPMNPQMPPELWAAEIMDRANWYEVLFNHDFARALWGSWPHEDYEADKWQHHLQAMVIAKNPIKYLGEHLD